MTKIKIYDLTGKPVEEYAFPDIKLSVSGQELSYILRTYHINLKQGTVKAKTRGEVSFSKRKPWRQKGTGRARAGTRGSPIWVKGGVAHGPRPYKPYLSRNKKQAQRIFSYMLGNLLKANKIFGLIDNLPEALKTKQAKEFLKTIGLLPYKVFIVTTVEQEPIARAFRNLKNVKIRRAHILNAFDLIPQHYIVATKAALENLKSRISTNA